MLTTKLKMVASFLAIVLITYLIMIVFIEFMVGCGSKQYNADGTWETMPCAFIPYETTTGTWR